MTRLVHSTLMATLALTALLASGAAAEDIRARPVGVVELFTSQGCSSCPKADAAIEKLADNKDVITVTYHVDYWNYLGWQDTLSTRQHTQRQYAYAKTLGNSNVYTPQIVLNGVEDVKTSAADHMVEKLDGLEKSGRGMPVNIEARLTPSDLTITIGEGAGKADVLIAYYTRNAAVTITSGENQGKTIVYRNAVSKIETIGMWDGKAMTIKLPAAVLARAHDDGCAILLQAHDAEGNPGRIYGAAAL